MANLLDQTRMPSSGKYSNEQKRRETASEYISSAEIAALTARCARYEKLIEQLIGLGVIREDLSIISQAADWVSDFVPWAQAKPHRSFKTMINYILEDGIGHKVGGQWYVDQNRYSALIDGRRDFPRLKAAD